MRFIALICRGVDPAGGGAAQARAASAPPLGGCGAVRLPERNPPVKGAQRSGTSKAPQAASPFVAPPSA